MATLGASILKIGGNTLISRVLGFVRDMVVARVFGANAATDAFLVAFRIPNTARRLFAEGAFSMAFVPVLTEHRETCGHADLKVYVDRMAGTLGALLLLVTALGVLAAPVLILVFAPGFGDNHGQRELAAALLRLTFPYILFISLTALAGGVLNAFGRFGVPAFTPVLLNLSLIGCALYLAPRLQMPIFALAVGVLVAGAVQLAFQVPFLARLGLLPRPRLAVKDPAVRRTLGLMGPALLGGAVGQISLLVATVLGSFLAQGSISWLYYADRLMELPVGLLGAALGTATLPQLSRLHAAGDRAGFSQTLDWGLRWLLLVGLPAAVGLMALAGPIVGTLFYSGEGGLGGRFGAADARMTAAALTAYSAGLPGLIAAKVLAPGYYARQRMVPPTRIAIGAVVAGALLSLVLMRPFGHLGLAGATAAAAVLNGGLLLAGLIREGVYRPGPGWRALLARALAANLAMTGVLLLYKGDMDSWLALGNGARAVRLALWIAIGGTVYLGAMLACGLRPRHLPGTQPRPADPP